jgi:hypothetical protein
MKDACRQQNGMRWALVAGSAGSRYFVLGFSVSCLSLPTCCVFVSGDIPVQVSDGRFHPVQSPPTGTDGGRGVCATSSSVTTPTSWPIAMNAVGCSVVGGSVVLAAVMDRASVHALLSICDQFGVALRPVHLTILSWVIDDTASILILCLQLHVIFGDMGASDAFTLCSTCTGKTTVCDNVTCAKANQSVGAWVCK